MRLKTSMQNDMNERLVILSGAPALGAYCAGNSFVNNENAAGVSNHTIRKERHEGVVWEFVG